MTLKKKIIAGFLGLLAFVFLLNAFSPDSETQNTPTLTQETPKPPVTQEETPTPAVPDPSPEETKKPLHPVSNVIDGDTIEVNFEGKIEKIRIFFKAMPG